ncbi:MAG: response regulator [Pseudomonadota bacterium]
MAGKRILIIDDHTMFRSGLRMLIETHLPHLVVFEAGTLREAIDVQQSGPDAVLLDIKLPGLNGVEGIALVRKSWPEVPVLMLSSQDDRQTVELAMARGATGFVSKADTAERIVALLDQVLEGRVDNPVPEAAAADVVPLTPRQFEVLELLCEGKSNKLIARALDVSENTVRWHVQAILETLEVSSRSEAAFMARRKGLVA